MLLDLLMQPSMGPSLPWVDVLDNLVNPCCIWPLVPVTVRHCVRFWVPWVLRCPQIPSGCPIFFSKGA